MYVAYAAVARVVATVAMMVYGAEVAATGTIVCIIVEHIYKAALWLHQPLTVLGWIGPSAAAPVLAATPISFLPASAWTYRYVVGMVTGLLSFATCCKQQQQP